MPARTERFSFLLSRAHGYVRAGFSPHAGTPPAFGSGHRAGTELSLGDELVPLPGQGRMKSVAQANQLEGRKVNVQRPQNVLVRCSRLFKKTLEGNLTFEYINFPRPLRTKFLRPLREMDFQFLEEITM
jgi:hypothetical protein